MFVVVQFGMSSLLIQPMQVQTRRSPDSVCLILQVPKRQLSSLRSTSLAYFFVIAVFSAGLSPIFAYACSLLGGRGNFAGWRWILVSFITRLKGGLLRRFTSVTDY